MLITCKSFYIRPCLSVLTIVSPDSGLMGLSAAFAESATPDTKLANGVVAFIFFV